MRYMNDREIVIPEVEGKTIQSMRLILTGSTGETEVSIDYGVPGLKCASG